MNDGVEVAVEVSAETTQARVAGSVARRLGIQNSDLVQVVRGSEKVLTISAVVDRSVTSSTIQLPEDAATDAALQNGVTVSLQPVQEQYASHVVVAPVPHLSIRSGQSAIREALDKQTVSTGDEVTVSILNDSLNLRMRILDTEPAGPVLLNEQTDIELRDGPAPATESAATSKLPPDAVGGYERTLDRLQHAIRAPLLETGQATATTRRRAGVVLEGPAGVGKTHLLRHISWREDIPIERVTSSDLLADSTGDLSDRLGSVATRVEKGGQVIIHLDSLDTVVEERSVGAVTVLREWLDRIATTANVVVVAEVTDETALPERLLQGARLSRTVSVSSPGPETRAAILETICNSGQRSADLDLAAIGRRAFGYLAADIVALWLSAREIAAARATNPEETVLRHRDFEAALDATEPSGIRGEPPEVPTTTFDDIGGLEQAKRELRRAIEWPLTNPDLFEDLSLEPPTGILLYGAPGTGKTLLARAVASTSDANFITVNGPELMNRYVGESERGIRNIFERARSNAPAVLFFDEIDAIGAQRNDDNDSPATARVVSQLLTELDGIEHRQGVTVIGATNRPDRLDDALLRPGRLGKLVEVPVPDQEARAEIFKIHLQGHTAASIDVSRLGRRTDGYTGSDIAAVVAEAGMLAIEEQLEQAADQTAEATRTQIEPRHIEAALSAVEPSLSAEARAQYESFEGPD